MIKKLCRLCWLYVCLFAAFPSHAQPFSFVALGDLPYGDEIRAYPPYRALIGSINKMQPPFSIHVGDVNSGSTLCSDKEFEAQQGHFNRFETAVVYTPGDNEWTDCHRANNGAYDPQERLQALRQRFFRPGLSLGKTPLQLQSQAALNPAYSKFVENQRWLHQQVLFVTLHIVGSNNNFEVRDPSAVAEYFERDKANVAWIRDAFALAQKSSANAIVFAMQADVFESKSNSEDFPGHSGFRSSIGDTLLPLAAGSAIPILLIHGDSHKFRFDQPFSLHKKPLKNLSRLIVPGASDVRAVQVTVDVGQQMPFDVRLIEIDK
jgi:hypothetical protein